MMRAKSWIAGVVGCLASSLLAGHVSAAEGPAPNTIPANCDRACLEAVVDAVQTAMVAHDPKRLPLSDHARYTEDSQAVELGDGFWATASAVGHYKHYFDDPEAGEAGLYGTMQENGSLCLVALRVRVQLGKITEIETIIYRKGNGPAWNDAGTAELDKAGKPPELWSTPIPAAQRATRQQLIATANKYFAGLQNNDGKGDYPFTDDCNRLENGTATTNNPDLKMGDATFNPAALPCKKQFETGFYGVVSRIHDRRFLLVDPELGAVMAFAVFNHGGTRKTVHLSDGRDFPMPFFSRPSSILISESFRIENSKIHLIEAVGIGVPYNTYPGWPGGTDGN